METIDYDFCNLTDREEDPFSDYDFCNSSTDIEQGPSTDSDNDSYSSGDVELDVQDDIDEVELQICQDGSIHYPTLALYAVENRNLRSYAVLEDVIKEHALSFLPAKSLHRFKTVCKKWNKWISSEFFAHKQSNYFRDVSGFIFQLPNGNPLFISLNPRAYGIPRPFSFLPEIVDIRATCAGLVCCQGRYDDNTYYVCNPVTKEWNKLSKPSCYHGYDPAIVLAFEPSPIEFAENYVLVCAVQSTDDFIHFEIYSSRTHTWTVSDTVCCDLGVSGPKSGGLYMKGYAYFETESGVILAFNLKNETLGFLELPPTSGPHGILAEMHGELCYILPKKETYGTVTMEIYGGFDMSLQRSIEINLENEEDKGISGEVRALACINDDTFAFLVGNWVIAYHVKEGVAVVLNYVENAGDGKYLPYVNSLVEVAPQALLEESEFCQRVCSGKSISNELSINQDRL